MQILGTTTKKGWGFSNKKAATLSPTQLLNILSKNREITLITVSSGISNFRRPTIVERRQDEPNLLRKLRWRHWTFKVTLASLDL
jgi:hypothetical protein